MKVSQSSQFEKFSNSWHTIGQREVDINVYLTVLNGLIEPQLSTILPLSQEGSNYGIFAILTSSVK